LGVILQPKSLVGSVVTIVGRVRDEELDNIPAIVKARWVGRRSSAEGDANEPPFAHVIIDPTNLM